MAVEIGSSADLMLGETVIALGNPFGLGHTVTTGVISAIDRPLETERRIYQKLYSDFDAKYQLRLRWSLVNIDG